MASLNFVTFNQDHSQLGVGTTKGYRIYNTEPFSKHTEASEGDVSCLEMLFSTSLAALTTSPRVLRIQNTKRHSTICELTFTTAILALRMNRKRLIVLLENEIFLYDISNMDLLQQVKSASNPNAICSLSSSSENNYLAYPLPVKTPPTNFQPPPHAPPKTENNVPISGGVMIYDATKLEPANIIDAHHAPLSCVTLNNDGTLLATASEKGTIIRVFSVPAGDKLYQFRRGSIPARIYSMSFNSTSTLLAVSSTSDTVHIFKLSPQNAGRRSSLGSNHPSSGPRERSNSRSSQELDPSDYEYEQSRDEAPEEHERKSINPTLASMIRRTSQTVGKSFAATVGGYLPSAVAEMWEPTRDFAWVKIPRMSSSGQLRNVVALSNNSPQVMVVTSEGNYYVFNIDLEKGGEGTLYKQFSLLEPQDLTATSEGLD